MELLDIDTYIKEAEIIERMYMDLLSGTTLRRMKHIDDGSTGLQNVEYRICAINSKNEPLQKILKQKYKDWYEGCEGSIKECTGRGKKSKQEYLAELYDRIITLIDLKDPVSNSNEKKHLKKEFVTCFDAQIGILHSIKPLVVSAGNDRIRLVAAELVNSELEEAECLYDKGLIHSAGIVAGKVLELYLKMLCEVHGIEVESVDTLLVMSQKLQESHKAHYFDLGMLEVVKHLVALRDKCLSDDEDEELQEDDVRELIDRVIEMSFLIFC